VDPDLLQARKYYAEGLRSFRRTRPPGPDTNRHLQEAARNFRKAQRFLENAARNDPNNADVQQLQVENNRFLYTCLKMQTL
jgi:hypothetical protein